MCKSVGGGGSDGECGVILFGSMEIDMKKILKLKVISKWFTVQMCTAYLVWLYECMIHANGKNVESKMRNEEIIIERKMQIKTFRKNYYEFRNKLLLLKITKERSKSYKLLTKECNLPPYRRNKWNEENAGNEKKTLEIGMRRRNDILVTNSFSTYNKVQQLVIGASTSGLLSRVKFGWHENYSAIAFIHFLVWVLRRREAFLEREKKTEENSSSTVTVFAYWFIFVHESRLMDVRQKSN